MTVCSAVWSAATRCIAVTMTSRAFSWASSRARRSIDAGELDRVVLGLLADGLEQHALGVLGADSPDTCSRATTCSWLSAAELLALASRARARGR